MNEKENACHEELSKFLVGYAMSHGISTMKMFDTMLIFAASLISDKVDEEDLRILTNRFYQICVHSNKVMKDGTNG